MVVIVVPTYNEADNIERFVGRLLELENPSVNILIVDDASPDGTGEIADRLVAEHSDRVRVIHRREKLGLGTAYLTGFREALDWGADYIFEMDADFSHNPDDVTRLFSACQDVDVAVGSRYVPGGSVDPDWSGYRKLLSAWGNWYARTVTGLESRDATAGFKCWSRNALEVIDLDRVKSDGYAFQVEMAYAAKRAGLKTVELPIVFIDRRQGQSKMSLSIVLEAVWRSWDIRFRY